MRRYRLEHRKMMRATQLMADKALPKDVMTVRASRWRTGRGSSSWKSQNRNELINYISAAFSCVCVCVCVLVCVLVLVCVCVCVLVCVCVVK